MRKLIVLTAFALACGGSSSNGSQPLSGTIGGKAFTPAEVKAIKVGTGQSPCTLDVGGTPTTVGVFALVIEVASYANVCADYATIACKLHASAQRVQILFALANPVPPAAEPAAAGTYTIQPDLSLVTVGTNVAVATALALATDATCGGTPSPAVQGGTLRLDDVAGPIKGHVSINFQGGGSIAGDFTADVCPGVSLDVCGIAAAAVAGGGVDLCTGTPSCT